MKPVKLNQNKTRNFQQRLENRITHCIQYEIVIHNTNLSKIKEKQQHHSTSLAVFSYVQKRVAMTIDFQYKLVRKKTSET